MLCEEKTQESIRHDFEGKMDVCSLFNYEDQQKIINYL